MVQQCKLQSNCIVLFNGKIVDMLISDRYSNQLMTSNAQFAFKKCHSTSMCTALVKEVVSYYNLLINLSEPFFDTTVGPRPNLARMCG